MDEAGVGAAGVDVGGRAELGQEAEPLELLEI